MRTNRLFALLLGALLLLEGILGLFSPVIFGRLTTNHTHAVIHIALGLAGFWAAIAKRGGGYATLVGLILVVVGGLWFVEAPREIIVRLLNVNRPVAIMNLVVGSIALLIGLSTRVDLVKR